MSIQDLIKDENAPITDEQLGELGKAAGDLVTQQHLVAAAERDLKEMKAEERRLAEQVIPELMDNLGMDKITLRSGHVISVKDAVQCGILAANRPKAYKWLDEHGHGGLIKTAVAAKFGRGEKEDALNAMAALEGYNPTLTESVHAGTLKAWARVELEAGRALPDDIFNVHVVRLTTVK